MGLARGAQIQKTSFSLPILQVPTPQLYAQMQQMQLEKDTFDTMKGLLPPYLQEDAGYATQYRDYIDNLSNTVTSKFADGKTSEAMRALRMAQSEVQKQWKPGGLAAALQSRYQGVQKAQTEIQEHTKKFQDPAYRAFYENQLQEQIRKGVGYDPDKGTFNPISTPQMQDEVRLGEEVDSFLKGWAADQGVDIQRSNDGYWYYKGTTERVDPREMQTALQSFYEQPHIQYALGVQSWYNTRQIPQDRKEEVLSQYRERMQQTMTDRADKAKDVYRELQDKVKTGRRADIIEAQKQLNKLGFKVAVDGVAGSETQNAIDDLVSDTDSQVTQMLKDGTAAIENSTLESLVQTQLRDKLTNTYVPKYAYTKRDIDMIANQPAIARLRASLTSSALSSLKYTFERPAPTLFSPTITEPVRFEGLVGTLKQAREDYDKLEEGFKTSLGAPWQNILSKFGTRPMAKSLTMTTNAVRSAMAGGEFDPVKYKEVLENQGVRLAPNELQEHAKFFSEAANRNQLSNMNDQLHGPYRAVEVNGDMYRDMTALVAQNPDAVDWNVVAQNAGVFEIYKTAGQSGMVVEKKRVDPDKALQLFQQGDPKVVKAFDKWVQKNQVDLGGVEGLNQVDIYVNEGLKGFRSQLETAVASNITSFVDYNTLTKQQRETLGIGKDGKIEMKDGKPATKVESVEFGVKNINGRTEPVVLVKSSAATKPIAVSYHQANMPWLQEKLRTAAAQTVNPNDPTQIVDPHGFNTFSAMLFDLEQGTGSAFDANTAYKRLQTGTYGQIGHMTANLGGKDTDIQTFLYPSEDGATNYFVTATTDGAANALRNARYVSSAPKPETPVPGVVYLEDIEKAGNTFGVQVDPTYQGVKEGILNTKVGINSPFIYQEIINNPYRIQKDVSNRTELREQIGESIINNMWN